MDFAGKVALVTGGASGIGAACARSLAAQGADVTVADVDEAAAWQVADGITTSGGAAHGVRVDVSDPASIKDMVCDVWRRCARLDVAVNNAGVGGPLVSITEFPLDRYRTIVDTNLGGVFFGLRYEVPAMVAVGGGVIINMSSTLGAVGHPAAALYAATKHAILGLTRSAALAYGPAGVRVVAVGPSIVDTPMIADYPAETVESMTARHPLGRIATTDDVAGLVCFLASDAAGFITGSYHPVDGGYLAE